MLQVEVRSGAAVIEVMSIQRFLGADQAPSAMFVEEAINRFNAVHQQANEPERAVLVRTYH